MDYKISELVAKTNVPKSTILYYIKEGLLPEAKKIKTNVHKYSQEHVELIKYIKYMQETMGSSIDEIKMILKNKNNSFSSSYTMLEPLMNTLSGDATGLRHYTKKEFIEFFDIRKELLEQLLKDDIVQPLSENNYTKQEAAIVNLVEHFTDIGIDYSILKEYVKHAKIISELEQQMQKSLCVKSNEDNFSTLWKILFDTLFNAKTYIFNRSTYKVLYRTLKNEMKG